MRDTISFNAGHIPGARNLDLHVDFDKKHLSELLSSDEEVAISCWGEECPYAAHACAKALTWGFSRVYYFPSGFQDLVSGGVPGRSRRLTQGKTPLPGFPLGCNFFARSKVTTEPSLSHGQVGS